MIGANTLNNIDNAKKDLIYNLDPEEFTKLINKLLIKQFDLFITEKDITKDKVLTDSLETREQKILKLNDFINDIFDNMPRELLNQTKIGNKVDTNEFREYQVNKLSDLLKENFELLERKETFYNLVINFFNLISSLKSLQTLILYNKGRIDTEDELITGLCLSFNLIDFYIDLFTNTEYKDKLAIMFNENTLKLIIIEIENHNYFLETFPVYKSLYEENKGGLD